MKKDIPGIVRALVDACDSRDPFEIARQRGIKVIREPLGEIRGYYNQECGFQFIHINCDLEWDDQVLVCAHELGHAILHPDANTPFLHAYTFYSVDKMEIEANQFLVCIEITDDVLLEYCEYPMALLAGIYRLPVRLIEWRYKQLEM